MRVAKAAIIVFLVGCGNDADQPPTDIPLPPDEVWEVIIHKDIKSLRWSRDRAEAIVVKEKELHHLHCWNYEIVMDAVGSPWWEETHTKVYSWRGRQRVSQHQFRAVIHVSPGWGEN